MTPAPFWCISFTVTLLLLEYANNARNECTWNAHENPEHIARTNFFAFEHTMNRKLMETFFAFFTACNFLLQFMAESVSRRLVKVIEINIRGIYAICGQAGNHKSSRQRQIRSTDLTIVAKCSVIRTNSIHFRFSIDHWALQLLTMYFRIE